MFEGLKLRKLAGAVRSKNTQEAYSAVLELGRIGSAGAIDLLVETLSRRDGLSRSAARELGRLKAPSAVPPLIAMLTDPEVEQAAAEAMGKMGSAALDGVLSALRSAEGRTRQLCVEILGRINDRRAVERLGELVQNDPDYEIRIAAATGLGQLKDSKAVWCLVNVLKLRDETTPERRASLERLRQAATLAMRRIGDPLAKRESTGSSEPSSVAAKEEQGTAGHPRLVGEISAVSLEELIAIMQELVHASEEISWAKLEQREPHLAPHFADYEMRSRTAELIGGALRRRGGSDLQKQVLKGHLKNHATVRNWWGQ